jgi:hypothetical protein
MENYKDSGLKSKLQTRFWLWEIKLSVPWFDCDESLTWRCLNLNSEHFGSFSFIFILFGELRLLVSWCAGGSCGMTCNDEDRDRSGRPGAENRWWSHRQDDREVGWRCMWSVLYMWWRWETRVSWLSLKTKVDEFFGWASKSSVTVFSDFVSKPVVTVSSGFVSKPVAQVSRFGPQNRQLRFGDLGLKITVTVSWFETQNQACFSLSVAPQNRWRKNGVGHTSRSGGLFRKVSHDRVSQSALKTDRGVTVDGARSIITEVTSKSSWRRTGRCDMLHRTLLRLLYRFLCIRC